MATVLIKLTRGEGFEEEEWNGLRKQVRVTNTVLDARIDLATGTPVPVADASVMSIIPNGRGDEWRAIVVPQTLAATTKLFDITVGGVAYKFSRPDAFSYKSGKQSNFTIRVDKKTDNPDPVPETSPGISADVVGWEIEDVDYGGVAE